MKTLLLIAAGACLVLPAAALAQPQPDRGVPDQHATMPRPADQRTMDQRTVDQRTMDQRSVGRPADEGRHDMRRDDRGQMDRRGFDDRRGGRWHHHRHQVCNIRHHHRVCFWR